MRRVAVVLVVLCAVYISSLLAQQALHVEPGTRVRVTANDCGFEGRATIVDAIRGDTLVLRGEPPPNGNAFVHTRCPIESLARIEVSGGRKSHWLLGMGVGFLAGAGVGALVGGLSSGCTFEWGSLCAAMGAVTGAPLGLLTGLTIGGLIESERWREIPLNKLQMGVVLRRDRTIAFSLSLKV